MIYQFYKIISTYIDWNLLSRYFLKYLIALVTNLIQYFVLVIFYFLVTIYLSFFISRF